MSERTHGGLTLRQYASVYAATSEGFPLELVLESEGLAPTEWTAIDEAWGEELAADLQADGELSDQFDLAMLEAQDQYRRPVPPLDNDLGGWLLFVRAWGAADDPVQYLHERGLGPNDLVRLHRSWSARLADDPVLQRQALALLDAEGEAPTPHPEPLELRIVLGREPELSAAPSETPSQGAAPALRAPLPEPNGVAVGVSLPARDVPLSEDDDGKTWVDGPLPTVVTVPVDDSTQVPPSSAVDAFAAVPLPEGFVTPPVDTVVPADPSLVGEELTLAQYAALCAELEVSPPEDALAIFIKYGLANDERRRRVDDFWRERLETRTQTYAEWRQLHRHFRDHFLSLKRSR
jgi:hypothetical protein